MKNIWGLKIPDGYYLARNGQVYKAKRESLLDRTVRERAEREAQEAESDADSSSDELGGYNANYNTYRGKYYWPSSFEVIDAPTSDKSTKADKRDRAIECAYNEDAELLVIVFRAPSLIIKDGLGNRISADSGEPPFIRYDGVSKEEWETLKTSESTGRWLIDSGVTDLATKNDTTSIEALVSEFGN
jgi:hypothetical protein